jgi:hypothetical protein
MLFLELPSLVHDAYEHLDLAEREFAESAFAPFWDQVENATRKLAEYEWKLRELERLATAYQQAAPKYGLPSLTLPPIQIPDARPVAARLTGKVRKAQRVFHFASIYEQRKTNAVLVDGFSTLSSAISDLGSMLSGTIEELAHTVDSSTDRLLVQMSSADAANRHYEKQSLRMLDDIRRGEKPLF